MVMHFYGPVIEDAIRQPKTSLDDLKILRSHATAILEAQGDLKKALKELDAEIRQREKAVKD